jgi:PAS domain S-box-containing protein
LTGCILAGNLWAVWRHLIEVSSSPDLNAVKSEYLPRMGPKSLSSSAQGGVIQPDVLQSTFSSGGEMGAQMRAHDWEQTLLGPVAEWPQSLRIALRILLGSGYPMLICWGPEFVMLYNDAYRPVLGRTKHPGALGRRCEDVFSEAWNFIGPLFGKVMSEGQDASTLTDQLFLLDRNGYLEETYFTFSYSPIPDDDGGVGGVLVTALETTERVIGDRQRRVLRDLASRTGEARTEEEVCRIAAATVAEEPLFLPFLLLYLYRAHDGQARLVARTGTERASSSPETIDCRNPVLWPLDEVLAGGAEILIEDLESRFEKPVLSSWGTPVRSACVAPVQLRGLGETAGFVIAGINPRRAFDEQYRQAILMVADQTATGIAGARAYEGERRRAEALAELDRAKTVFFSNVSHEFRTPLTLMLGPLEDVLAESAKYLPENRREQLAVARRNALRLLKLVNTLLDFSRIEAGRVQAVYEPVDLAQLTAEIASVFRSAMDKAGLKFRLDCENLREPVFVDREMWEKIVLNLLSNAFKFTFEGEIALALRSAEGCVELSVRDTGIGIPSAELPRVFERFRRVESTRARTHEGTGIGLALVQELVKLHGGSVSVESVEARGSTFRVSIPKGTEHLPAEQIGGKRTLASTALGAETYVEEAVRWLPGESGAAVDEQAPALLPSLTAADAGREKEARETVLIADDNADMRDYLSRMLSPTYNVHTAMDGFDAVETAQLIHPDLILTDIMMPGLDGFGVLRAVRNDAEIGRTPVIMLSARAGEESQVEGLDAGADDYLVKPFTAREMLARIATHIRIAKMRDQAAKREARLRAEAELAQHRLQEMMAQIPAAVGLLNGPEHRWTYVNEGYVRVTGRKDTSDFIGKTVGESLPEIANQGLVELLDRVYQTGMPYLGCDYRVCLNRGPDGQGEDAYFDFAYTPFRDAQGEVTGILVHAVEVTDKIAAKKMLEENQLRLRQSLAASRQLAAIVESSDDAIISKDLRGIVTTWNRCAERIFGYTAEEMIGQPITKIIPPELQDDEERILATIARGEKIDHVETVRLTKDGRKIEVSLTISPIRDEMGAIVGASKIARDITERKQKEQLLRTTERLASVGRLAATVAHEINNPLEGATNLVYLARSATDLTQIEAFLAQADEELKRVAFLSRQTLGFYRETRGATGFRLGRVVDSLIAAFSSKARNRSIEIKWEMRQDAQVYAIESEVRQLVANLLNNSIEATFSNGTVWVRVSAGRSREDETVTGARITIADSGPGIEARHRAKLFEPFFTTKREVGTGLGLWISKGIVDRHGGSIRFRSSVEKGRSGTAFMVFLPDKSKEAAGVQAEGAPVTYKLTA